VNVRPGDIAHNPEKLIGTFRRFGSVGPVYRVTGVKGPKKTERRGDDLIMDIEIVESAEHMDYSYWDILQDPLER